MSDFLKKLSRDPFAQIDGASIVSVDELGNGYDYRGTLIAPKFEAPEQSWGEAALGVLTAPQRLGGAVYDSLTPYQFPQLTSTPMNRAGAGQPITGGSGDGGWQVPPIIGEGVNALTAVGDAYNYGMTDDEINSRALGMAGFMMGGGGLAARPAGGTGMFAGRLARTADHEALARAEKLAAEGADRNAIWNETGWFQGPDQKWRFEIDDSGSAYNPTRGATQVGHALSHPDLAAAYPDVPGVKLNFSQKAGGGAYNETFDRVGLGQEATPKDHGVLLHELQHRVQKAEGFGPGSNEFQLMQDEYLNPLQARDAYKITSGEVESRNVERRLNMSADQRRATPPWETQDIPDIDQIVRLYSNASKEGAAPALISATQTGIGLPAFEMRAPGGKSIGRAQYDELPNAVRVKDVEIDPAFRRQGMASRLYGEIQDRTGKPMTPDTMLTPDGKAFWESSYPKAVSDYEFDGQYWRQPYTPDESVPDWRMSGGPNRPEGALWSNASKESSIPAIASALEQKGARPEPSANALSSELSGTGFYPLSGGAETGTYLAFDDIPGNAPSPKQQQVRQMAAGHQGRMRSHPGQQAPEGLSSKMGGQELDSSGTPIGSFLDRSHYPRTGLNPIHEVHNWAKVRSMARKAINGEHVPGYLYDGLNGNGNLIAGTHRAAANELLDILGYGKRIKSANINDVLDEPEAYGLSARNADRLRQAAEDGDYRLIDEIWDQSRDTSLFSNSDSRPALLASALGQEEGYAGGGRVRSWTGSNEAWNSLTPFQKAAAMALMEADAANIDDARNALGAMVNRAKRDGVDIGEHVSKPIYQPTIEPAQERRLGRIMSMPQFSDLTGWAERRWSGQEPDNVQGATHFLAPERTMVALTAREPNKYRSWPKWTGYNPETGSYKNVVLRDGSHAFVAPEGTYSAPGKDQGSINGGYGVPPTGYAGVAGDVVTADAGHEVKPEYEAAPTPVRPLPTPTSSYAVASSEAPASTADAKPSFDFMKLASLFSEPEPAPAPQVQLMPIQAFQTQGTPIEATTPYRSTFAHGGQVRGLPDGSEPIHAGPLHSTVPGRTDHLPITVAAGSFVLPADIVSSLGEGNTNAGMETVSKMFPLPPVRRADGGRVPIAAAGGEFVIAPETVAALGNGDLDAGHELLDQFVRRARAQNIQRLRALPGPEK